MDEYLFPEAYQILEEAEQRHARVWPFAFAAIELAHTAFQRQRDLTAHLVPGIPHIRRARNDINDDCWRYFRSIAEPLVEDGLIREFRQVDGGDIVVFPDGLPSRIKKGGPNGETSNVGTGRIEQMSHAAAQMLQYPDATELDVFITSGLWIDLVYIAGDSMPEYTQVGLRFANAKESPFLTMSAPSDAILESMSPAAYQMIADTRERLAG